VKHNGAVLVDKRSYYISRKLRGHHVLLKVDAAQGQFIVYLEGKPLKQVAIQGLHNQPLAFEDYLKLICQEAISEWRRWQWTRLRRVTN
jgi:hypothetical protein